MKINLYLATASLLAWTTIALAQNAPTPTIKGHWTGSVQIPDRELKVEVDLDKTEKGWIGSINLPDMNAIGLPLEAISESGGTWSFRVKGVPGSPTFKGKLGEDGKSIAGDFGGAAGTAPFKLALAGDPKVAVEKPSAALPMSYVGNWEGTLQAGSTQLRLQLKLANSEAGSSGSLVSIDQGGGEIAISSIELAEGKLTLSVRPIGGGFEGKMNKEGTELAGTWSQGGNQLPLTFARPGAKSAKP